LSLFFLMPDRCWFGISFVPQMFPSISFLIHQSVVAYLLTVPLVAQEQGEHSFHLHLIYPHSHRRFVWKLPHFCSVEHIIQ
jgi:hypothetical protein